MAYLARYFAALSALLITVVSPATTTPIVTDKGAVLAELDGRSFYRSNGVVQRTDAAADTCTSCSSCSQGADACTVNTPGGLLLLTTFWDTNPATGPSDSFTIHGLWPDNCDGGYDSSCDSSRAYTNIEGILQNAGKTDLLNYMNTQWIPDDTSNESFWEHEWSKHGTCVSTLNPKCYSDYTQYQDLIDFFQTAVDLHQKYNIYQALSNAGYTPGSQQFQLSDLEDATSQAFGQKVLFQCKSGAITGGWLSFHTQGRSTTADGFELIAPTSSSRCPSTVSWTPKDSGDSSSSDGSYY